MLKKTYAIALTYQVSDAEKVRAEQTLLCFDHALKALKTASNHLDIMKTPFKDHPEMSPEEIMEARAAIRRFRDKFIENFNTFKNYSFQCVNSMQMFTSDTQVTKIMKSFVSTVDELESEVNSLADLFNDLQSKDFAANVVTNIESVQNRCQEIEDIVEDRINHFIKNNILAKSWVDGISNTLQTTIEKNTPLILDLFDQRQQQLNTELKERTENQ